ncbi:hypothetical protein [Clostridium sp. 1001271B_151109_B4]|uniref:hypothetical protein n=1 Tax=Clostridium sp. 1001271B_151109_B4 TaxID=2787148 RepID=UPI0018A8E173|nr:hypothetical protein [Clostridium sp. 1001271B_151109_B4]
MKKSKNKIIMIVLTATIISNTMVPISTLAESNTILKSQNYVAESQGKEEVIYINLDGNGEVSSAYAVNIFDSQNILDYGDYSEIRNMNTNDTLSYDNGEITGNSSIDKLYYEGTLKEVEIPWNINIKYYLDGKEISSNDLAGKSGTLEIKISITDNEKCNSTFFENYALQTTITLDTEKCNNIEAEGATIANVGSEKQISHIILPNKGKEISIKADVNDFEMASMTINGVKLGLSVDVDTNSLLDRVNELTDAIEKLDSGAISVNDGSTELNNGTYDLSNGMNSLSTGVNSLNDGIITVYKGLQELNSNSKNLTSGSKEVLDALNEIGSALNNINISNESISELVSASSDVQTGINELVSAITLLQGNTNYEAYKSIMNANGLDIDYLQSNNASAIENMKSQISVLTEARDNLLVAGVQADDSQIIQIQTQIEMYNQIITLLQGNMASISGTESYLNSVSDGIGQVLGGATELQTKYTEFNNAIQGLSALLNDMIYNMSNLSTAINTLISEYNKLDVGINEYTNGVATLLQGYSQLVEGSTNLVNGTSTLKSGAEKLSSGVAELKDGTMELSKGTTELNDKTANLDTEITDEIDKMVDDLDGTSDEIVSFTSEKNTNVKSVQFVIKTPEIKKVTIEVSKDEEKSPTLWERIINLFK